MTPAVELRPWTRMLLTRMTHFKGRRLAYVYRQTAKTLPKGMEARVTMYVTIQLGTSTKGDQQSSFDDRQAHNTNNRNVISAPLHKDQTYVRCDFVREDS